MTERTAATLVRLAQLIKADKYPDLLDFVKSSQFKQAIEQIHRLFPTAFDELYAVVVAEGKTEAVVRAATDDDDGIKNNEEFMRFIENLEFDEETEI